MLKGSWHHLQWSLDKKRAINYPKRPKRRLPFLVRSHFICRSQSPKQWAFVAFIYWLISFCCHLSSCSKWKGNIKYNIAINLLALQICLKIFLFFYLLYQQLWPVPCCKYSQSCLFPFLFFLKTYDFEIIHYTNHATSNSRQDTSRIHINIHD